MVQVMYRNRLGNRLFQYCYGRVIAELMDWRLHCQPIPGFPATEDQVSGASFTQPSVLYDDNHAMPPEIVAMDRSPRHIVLRGWFQRYDFYAPYAKQIRKWVQPLSSSYAFPDPGPQDLLFHLRIGKDYELKRWIVHPEFYEEVLGSTSGVGNLYICYDARERISAPIYARCVAPFLERGAIAFCSQDPLVDFNFARRFRRIAIAPSTFCWWAAYLSHAERIFFPDLRNSQTSCWRGMRDDIPPVRLEVDEPQYQYVNARTLWD